MNHSRLASFKIERRSLAAAVFAGEQIDYTQVRQLSSDHAKAESSAVGFEQWIVETFETQSATVERSSPDSQARRTVLTAAIIRSLRKEGISVWEVHKSELLRAFGAPPLKTRKELREIVRTIWPVLPAQKGNGSTSDAAALGLYVQIQRRFDHY